MFAGMLGLGPLVGMKSYRGNRLTNASSPKLQHWEKFSCEEAVLVEDCTRSAAQKTGGRYEMLIDGLTIELAGKSIHRVRDRNAQILKTQRIIRFPDMSTNQDLCETDDRAVHCHRTRRRLEDVSEWFERCLITISEVRVDGVAYPDAVDPNLVGKYSASAKAGGGYVWDDVL